ncbi:MAG: helix-turn-helix domain-containing protein [Spirochaetales bacterium]|nr:helix-turn-helix domain-containing protein [Spirochaetales bacterium]
MESVGQKLRETREQHNFSIEQVARDTHISKQYLEALEQENFATIPGETYIIGFLRNYAEYLSLNPEEIVNLYKNIQIQEQPLPMTELLEPVRPRGLSRILVLAVIVLAVLGAGGYLLYRYVIASPQRPRPQAEAVQESASPAESQQVVFQEEAMTRWFNLNDTIGFPLNGNTYPLQLVNIDRTLTVRVPGGTLDMTVGQDRQLDVNGDGRNDLRILLNDIDATGVAKRANLSLYKITKATEPQVAAGAEGGQGVSAGQGQASSAGAGQETAGRSATAAEAPAAGGEAAAGEAEPAAGPAAAPAATPAAVSAGSAAGTMPIITAAGPSPFRVTVSFRGYCLFRYVVDNDIREERFFHKGESFSLDARNEVQLWISNAGVVRLMVAGRELEAGRPGAVTTKQVRWRREETGGQYTLEVITRE